MQVHFLPLAQADLVAIKEYIAQDRPLAAARLIRSIRGRIQETIASFPESGQACDELLRGLRRFPIGSYVKLFGS